MKKFKKKHTRIPSRAAILRMLTRVDVQLALKYEREYQRTPEFFPDAMRVTCLPSLDANKRLNIRYYPDMHNFRLYEAPNRSLPIPKFLDMFRPFVPEDEIKRLEHELTNYRLEFYTDPARWIEVYADDSVHSCMSQSTIVECYAHPQNKLALATLYPPGSNQVIARTIVNTDEKWYVRLFGDPLLVDKLNNLGYRRLNEAPSTFRMYAQGGNTYSRETLRYPYFDFIVRGLDPLPDTFDPATGKVEIIINP